MGENEFQNLNAIDGEQKPARDFSEGNMGLGGISYKAAEAAIRSDVDEILNMSYSNFENWYSRRKKAVKEELERYELIADIPDLRYGSEEQQYDLTANTNFRQHLKLLRRANKFLDIIKEKWEDKNTRTINPKT